MAVTGSIRSKCPMILGSFPSILSTDRANLQRIRREPFKHQPATGPIKAYGSSNNGYLSFQHGKLSSTMCERSYTTFLLHQGSFSSLRLNSNWTSSIDHPRVLIPSKNAFRSCTSVRFYSSRRTEDRGDASCDNQEKSCPETDTRSSESCPEHQSSSRDNQDCESNPGDLNDQDCQPAPGTCSEIPVDEPCPEPPPVCSDPQPPCPEPVEPCPRDESRNLALWRALSLFLALPLVLVTLAVIYSDLEEEANEPGPPYLDVPYMYRRTKPFPWRDGNRSLLHNPRKNPVRPDGYEVQAVKEVEALEEETFKEEEVVEDEAAKDEPEPTEESD